METEETGLEVDGDRRDRKGGDRDRRDRRWDRRGQKRVGYTAKAPQGPSTVCKQGSPGRGWQMKCSHTPT